MPIMSARPRFDLPGSHPSIFRMLDTAMPANSAVHGRSEMKNDSTAADSMNAPTVARALPFVSRMSANTIFVGSFVFNNAAVMPNDAKMKKMTLLMNPLHTPPLNSNTPNTGMSTIITRPAMATGTGSVTHRKMPATISASDILPASVSPSGVGPNHAAATSATATATQSTRLAMEAPSSPRSSPPSFRLPCRVPFFPTAFIATTPCKHVRPLKRCRAVRDAHLAFSAPLERPP